MDRSRGSLAALLLLLCSGCAWRAQAQVVIEDAGTQGTYDPCKAPPRSVKKGDPFVFGMAFWPGGTISSWGAPYNTTSGAPGLNPCLTNGTVTNTDGSQQSYQAYLAERGVVFASYMVKVDTISAIRNTRAEMDQLWAKVLKDADSTAVISAIAFRGQNRSEPHLLRSNASAQSEGTGIVEQLSLLVSWNRGSFDGFQWYNQGPCDGCGGLSGARCVQTQYDPSYQRYPESACATSFESCECALGLKCPSNNCTTTVYLGHRGSDKSGRVLESGYQIQQINQYSITSFFWKLLDGAFNILGNSGIGTVGGSGSVAAPVVLDGDTDAALAANQAAQQAQGQPLASNGTR